MQIDKQITIDLNHVRPTDNIRIHVDDKNSVRLALTITKNNVAVSLSNITVKYDAAIAGYLAEMDAVGSTSGSIAYIPITNNMVALPGLLQIDVKFIESNQILYTQTISMTVDKSIIDETAVIDLSGTTIGRRLDGIDERLDELESEIDDFVTDEEMRGYVNYNNGNINIGNNSIPYTQDLAGKLSDSSGSVKAGHIASNAVTAGKLASNAVTNGKIANSAVTNEKIENGTVNTEKLNLSYIDAYPATHTDGKIYLVTSDGVKQAIDNLPSRGKHIIVGDGPPVTARSEWPSYVEEGDLYLDSLARVWYQVSAVGESAVTVYLNPVLLEDIYFQTTSTSISPPEYGNAKYMIGQKLRIKTSDQIFSSNVKSFIYYLDSWGFAPSSSGFTYKYNWKTSIDYVIVEGSSEPPTTNSSIEYALNQIYRFGNRMFLCTSKTINHITTPYPQWLFDYTWLELSVKPKVVINSSSTSYEGNASNNSDVRFTKPLTRLRVHFPSTIEDDFRTKVAFIASSSGCTFGIDTCKLSGDDVSNNVLNPVANKTYNLEIYNDSINMNCIVRGVL